MKRPLIDIISGGGAGRFHWKRRAAYRSTQRGFTLVEIVVSIALLGFFMAIAVSVIIQSARVTREARDRSVASALAWNQLERIRNTPFSDMDAWVEGAPGTRVATSGLADPEGEFLRQTAITTTTNGMVLRNIRVEVWPLDRRTNDFDGEPEVLETIIADVPLEEI